MNPDDADETESFCMIDDEDYEQGWREKRRT